MVAALLVRLVALQLVAARWASATAEVGIMYEGWQVRSRVPPRPPGSSAPPAHCGLAATNMPGPGEARVVGGAGEEVEVEAAAAARACT